MSSDSTTAQRAQQQTFFQCWLSNSRGLAWQVHPRAVACSGLQRSVHNLKSSEGLVRQYGRLLTFRVYSVFQSSVGSSMYGLCSMGGELLGCMQDAVGELHAHAICSSKY